MSRGFGGGAGNEPDDPNSPYSGGRHFTSGSGLLGLAGALGAFDKPAQLDPAKQTRIDKEQAAIQTITDEVSKGKSVGQALRDNPDALKTMMLGNHLKDIGYLQNLFPDQSAGNVSITKGGQVIRQDANGNLSAQDIPGYRQDPGKPGAGIQFMKGADGKIYSVDKSTGTMTPAHTQFTYGPDGNVTGGGDQPGKPDKPAKDVAPGQISQEDRRFFSVAGNAYSVLGAMKDFASTTGPITGGFRQFLGERFGMGDTAQAWGALTDQLEQAELTGLLPRGTSASFKHMVDTNPSVGKSSEFNTTLINGLQDNLRSQTQSRLDTAETNFTKGGMARVNGQPVTGLPDEALREPNRMDVYGKGQSNKSATWKLRNAPDTLTGPDVEGLYNGGSPHFLPQDQAKLDQFVAGKARDQQRQAQPQGQPTPAAPISPQAGQGTPSTGSGGTGDQPTPQIGVAPTTADQQPQLPQQIQSMQAQMSPPTQSPSQVPPGGVNPASLQPNPAELARQQQAQDLITQSRGMADPNYVPGQGF
jgi:hypothetical protein